MVNTVDGLTKIEGSYKYRTIISNEKVNCSLYNEYVVGTSDILFEAKLQLIGYKKILSDFEYNAFKEFLYYMSEGNSSIIINIT